jgi:hypothetical protein
MDGMDRMSAPDIGLPARSAAQYRVFGVDVATGEAPDSDLTVQTSPTAIPFLSVGVVRSAHQPAVLRGALESSTAVDSGRLVVGISDQAIWPVQDHRMLSWVAGGGGHAQLPLPANEALIVIVDPALLFSDQIVPTLLAAIADSNPSDAHRYSLWLNMNLSMRGEAIVMEARGTGES